MTEWEIAQVTWSSPTTHYHVISEGICSCPYGHKESDFCFCLTCGYPLKSRLVPLGERVKSWASKPTIVTKNKIFDFGADYGINLREG